MKKQYHSKEGLEKIKAVARETRAKYRVEKICPRCGTKFWAITPSRKYCYFCMSSIERHRTKEWRMIKKQILERDKGICRLCGKASKYLAMHHIDGSGNTKFPNENLENLISLCRGCHMKVHMFLKYKKESKEELIKKLLIFTKNKNVGVN